MDKPRNPPADDRPSVRRADRLAREAEALRANLRKRKDQARQREAAEPPAPRPDRDGGTDA
jgi:hypothetical protein